MLIGGAVSAHASDGHKRKAKALPGYSMSSSFAAPDKTRQYLAQNQISASQAKSIARKRVGGGEVVDITKKGDTYRVRVITKSGRVVDVYVDANTGRVRR